MSTAAVAWDLITDSINFARPIPPQINAAAPGTMPNAGAANPPVNIIALSVTSATAAIKSSTPVICLFDKLRDYFKI